MSELIKDPDAVLDYAVDWTPFLAGTAGDTIATAVWVEIDEELTVQDLGFNGPLHTAMVSGGTLSRTHSLTSRITTVQGRVTDTTIHLFIKNT